MAVAVRPWPNDPTIRHLVLLELRAHPAPAEIEEWVGSILDDPAVTRVRTGALFPASVPAFTACGFRVADRLALLERPLPRTGSVVRPEPPPGTRLRTMRRRDLGAAADIDTAAFPAGWGNDASSLTDIARATPVAAGRIVSDRRRPIGFAITGKAGPIAYLQRLAVDPGHQRRGVARALVDDAVHRMTRKGATSIVVNTGVDNRAALGLYADAGFHRSPDELVVMDRLR